MTAWCLPDRPRLLVEELEPRILYSADAAALLGLDGAPATLNNREFVPAARTEASSADRSESQQIVAREIVFVDSRVPDAYQLADELARQRGGSRQFDIVILQADRDGVDQISRVLAGETGLTAIHIVSHGSGGAVEIGSGKLDSGRLDVDADSIARWGRSLITDGDLLLYGCDVASDALGESFVQKLARLTGTDVAASRDTTGSNVLGGNWTLEYATGSIEAGLAPLQWQGTLAAVPGTAIFRDSTAGAGTTPQINRWDGAGFGGTTASASAGAWKIIAAAESPTRTEIIAIGIDNAGVIQGQVWNGSSWSLLPFAPGTASQSTYHSFDVAYDQTTGNAMLVWDGGGALNYSIWNGSTWTTPTAVAAAGYTGGEPLEIRLAAKPNSSEMVLVINDAAKNSHALVWNGNSWGNAQLLGTAAANIPVVGVAYEQASGRAMVLYASGAGVDTFYRSWNGSSWSAQATLTAPAGSSGAVHWTVMTADTSNGSNRLAVGYVTDTPQTWFAVWDGSSWSASAKLLGAGNAPDATQLTVGVAFEHDSGRLMAAYARTGSNAVVYNTWSAAGGWSVQQSAPDIGAVPNSIRLDASPAGNDIMLSVQDATQALMTQRWDGTGFANAAKLTTNTTQTKNQPFVYVWDTAAVNVAPSASNLNAAQTYTEDTPLPLTAIVATDPDSASLTATLSLSNTAAGSLNTGTSGAVTSTYDANSGVWTASGAVTDVNALLAGLVFTPTVDFNADFTIATRISDGIAPAVTGSKTMTGVAVNDAPVVTTSVSTKPYPIGSAATAVDAGLTIIDIDSANLASATVTISGGFAAGRDALGFVTQNGISGAWNAASGVLALSGSATTTLYEAALRSVTFSTTSTTSGPRGVSFVASDGNASSVAASRTITVGQEVASLWVSSKTNAITSAGSGSVSYNDGQIARLSDPNLLLGPGTTSGTFSRVFDIDAFAADGNADISGMHVVSRPVTVGTSNAISLLRGDILMTVAANETFTGIAVTKQDILLFRPTVSGDYSAGTFSLLIRNPGGTGAALRDFTLVETPMTIGGSALVAGDFLLVLSGGSYDKDVSLFRPTTMATPTTGGALSVLIDGDGSPGTGISQQIHGLELVQNAITLGGAALSQGQLLVQVNGNANIGSNGLAVTGFDIVALNISATGNTTSVATASMLLRGADVGLNQGGEEFDALALVGVYNTAPVLDNSRSPVLANLVEDAAAPSGPVGSLVSSLVDFSLPAGQLDNVSDPDTDAQLGIAITAADASSGNWFYSIDNGAGWTALGAVAPNNARLLAADALTRLYYQPSPNSNGMLPAAIAFRAWDQSKYNNGDLHDTSVNGETTPFSTATDTASLNISAVNDAPVLDNSASMTLPTISKVQTNNSGESVRSIIDSAGGDRITDVDAGALEGIAIDTLVNGNGNWQYSIDGRSSWTAIGTVNAGSALLLRETDFVRFVPNASAPTNAGLSFRAWDQTSGSAGDKVDASIHGGSSAFSSAQASATITVVDINSAPVLDSSASPMLDPTVEDAGAPVGPVGTLISALVDFSTPAGQLDNASDADTGSGLGIAVTGASTTSGSWFWSIDNGVNWNALGAVSDSSAQLLAADGATRVYFQPNPNAFGNQPAALTFRAWDRSTGSNGGTTPVTTTETLRDTFSAISYSNNNGSSAWASSWTELGDNGGASGGAIKVSNSNELQVTAEVGGHAIYRAADLGNASAATFSFAYTSTLTGTRAVSVQVSADGGSSWSTLALFNASTNTGTGTRSYDIGAFMSADTRIRMLVSAGGSVTETVHFDNVQIQYTATGGGSSAFSKASDTAGLTVSPVADTPSVTPATTNEDTQSTSGLVITRSGADGAEVGFYKVSGIANGSLYKTDGTTAIANGAFITAAEGSAGLRFTPAANYFGSTSFNLQASTSNNDAGLGGGVAVATVTVNAVNDAPTATNLNVAQSYTEDTPLALTAIVASDIDSATLSATLTLSNPAAGSLNVGTSGAVTSSYDVATGVWTASGPTADINALLGTLVFTPSTDFNAAFTIATRIDDGIAPAVTGSKAMTGTAVNDAPVLTTSVATKPYPIGSAATRVDEALTIFDSDSSTLGSATVTVSGGYVAGRDVLGFVTQNGITGSWTSAGGVLTLTGTATAAQYEAALQSVTFRTTSVSSGPRVVSFVVSDGMASSAAASRTITVGQEVPSLWVSAKDQASTSAGSGSITYNDGQIARLSDPALMLGAGPNSGTFSRVFDIDSFITSGTDDGRIKGLHVVSRPVTVGSTNAVPLQRGDILLTLSANETLGGTAVTDQDIVLFRPTVSGDYSAGTFSVLIHNPANTGSRMRDFALVETAMTIGGRAVAAGDFLLVMSGSSDDKDVLHFRPTTMASSNTGGTLSVLIDGDNSPTLNISQPIRGLELVQNTVSLGGFALSQGQLLVQVDGVATIGSNGLAVTGFDIAVLDVLATGSGTSVANASMLLRGSSFGLTNAGEEFDAFALVGVYNTAPVLDSSRSPALASAVEDAGAPSGAVGTLVSSLVDSALPAGQVDNVSDPDTDAKLGIAITAADVGSGSWFYSTNDGVNWNPLGAIAPNNARLLAADAATRLYYQPSPNSNGTLPAAITFRAWDQSVGNNGSLRDTTVNGETTPFSTATDTASLNISAVNDAPVLDNSASMTLPTISKVQTNNSGESVRSIIDSAGGDRITDVDAGALEGIAIDTLVNGNGSWQYSIDGRSSWTAIGTVNAGSALLLRETDFVRFVPNASAPTNASLSFRAWDQTSGSAGDKVDASIHGGSSAFSSAQASATITVVDINSAPVLDSSASPMLDPTVEDAGTPVGPVGTLISALVDFSTPAGQLDNASDADTGSGLGIAVTGASTTSGSWFWSIDNGVNWNALGAVSDSSAQLLAADGATRVYFQPNPNAFGNQPAALTFRAWDRSTGNNGDSAAVTTTETLRDTFSVVSYSNNNGSSAWASSWTELGDNGGASGGAIKVSNSNELQVTAEVGGHAIYRAADLGNASAATFSFAYTSTLTGARAVSVQVSADGGTSWSTLALFNASTNTGTGTRSYDIGAFMSADTRIRMLVSAGGSVTETVHFDNVQIQYTATGGGSSAFSKASDTAGLTVSPVADTPSVTPATTNEDTQSTSGLVITRSGADGAEVGFYKVTGIANGSLYKTDGTTAIANGAFITAAEGSAGLRFTPAANYFGSTSFNLQASTASNDAGLGGGVAVATITVNAVNDAPTATNLNAAQSYTEDTPLALTAIVASDIDSATLSATLTLSNPAAGSLNVGTSGAVTSSYDVATGVWTASGPTADINALLGTLVFTPSTDFNAAFTIATRIDDGIAPAVTGSKAMTGTAVNDAPVLTGSNNLAAINRNPGSNGGTLVAELLTGRTSDGDASALTGLAVTAVDNSNGAWQYSIDGGSNWAALAGVTPSNARLLGADSTTLVRFVPTADYAGNVANGLTFRAWDQTSGAAGGLANTSVNGGSGAFSAASAAASIMVSAGNTAPVLSGGNSFNAIVEDATTNSGTLVSALITGRISDADPGALRGIAVTGLDTSNGDWQYTLDGSTWTSLASPTMAAARLLAADATTAVRFVPNLDFNGSVAAGISFQAWDQTVGANGAVRDLSTAATLRDNFATVAYSNNDGSASWSTDWIDVDASPIGGSYRIVAGQLQIKTNNTTDSLQRQADLRGVTRATVSFDYSSDLNLGSGGLVHFQASGNGGATYTTLASFSDSLRTGAGSYSADISTFATSTTRIRFVTAGASPGETLAIDNLQIAYAASGGGSTAFSQSTASSAINVLPVNDAPVRSGGMPAPISVAEDSANDAAVSLGLGGLSYGPGGGADEAGQTLNFAITAIPSSISLWQADGTSPVAVNQSLSLAQLRGLSYRTIADANGSSMLSWTVQDSGGTDNGGIDALSDSLAITVTPVNDAPTATGLNVAQTYVEDTPLALSAIVTSDIDSPNLTATLTLSNPAAGRLNVATSGSVTSSYDAATGSWTATGPSAELNALLAALVFTPGADFNATFTIAIRISDGVAPAITGSKTMTGSAVNDAPVLTGSNNLAPINRNPTSNPGTLVLDLIAGRLADADAGALRGIAVTAVDTGSGSWQYSINGGSSWAGLGSSTPTAARLLAADSSTLVRFVPNPDFSGTVSNGLTYRGWDQTSGTPGGTADTAAGGSSTAFSAALAHAAIIVTSANTAPVLSGTNPLASITEDATSNGGTLISALIAGRITDADPGAVRGVAVTAVDNTHGSWQYTLNGSTWLDLGSPGIAAARLLAADATTALRFVPTANVNGVFTDAITLRAWDQTTGINGGLADVSGKRGNYLDTFSSASYDNSNGSLNWAGSPWIENDAAGGAATGGNYFVAPPLLTVGESAAGRSISRQADLSGAVSATWSFVLAGNDLGGGGHIAAQVSRDGGATFTTLLDITAATVTGTKGFDISAFIAANTQVRFLDVNGGGKQILIDNVNIVLSANQGGSTAFSGTDATSGITVAPVNDAPVRSAGMPAPIDVGEDSVSGAAVSLGLGGLGYGPGGGTDEAGQTLTYRITAIPSTISVWQADGTTPVAVNQSLSLTQLRGLSYRTIADANGPSMLRWAVQDNGGTGNGGIDTLFDGLAITITPVNDAPSTTPVTLAAIAEDSGARLITQSQLLVNANDVDGPSLSATGLVISSGLGSLVDNGDGSWRYTPALNDDTSVGLSYTVTDGSLTAAGTASLDITPVNDAPTSSAVTLAPIAEDSGARLITQSELLANAADVEGSGLSATGLLISSGAGSLVANGDGSWSYTPVPNDDSSVVFTYLVTDGSLSALGAATLNLTPVNDAPTTSTVALAPIAEDSGSRRITQADLLANAGDIDGPSLVATNLAISSGLGSLVDNGDGSWRYTPALNDDTSVGLSYTVTDGSLTAAGTASLDITPVNDAPTTSAVTLAPIAEDSGARLITQSELLANAADVEGSGLSATGLLISSGAGSLIANGDGSWSYTPVPNDDSAVVFTYMVTDGSSSAPGTATLDLTPVNDAPTTSTVALAPIAEDSGSRRITQADLLANAGDIDGPSLVATNLAIKSGLGSLVDNGDGSWRYTPALNDDTSVGLSYTVTDGSLTAAGTATLDITPVNDAPTTSAVTLAPIAEDSGARLITQSELLANAADVEGSGLSATGLLISSGAGSLIANGDGSWSYTPVPNDDSAVVFTYMVTDGSSSAPGTATLDLTPVNEPPTTSTVALAPIAEDSGSRRITQAELLTNAGDIDGPSLVATNLAIKSGLGSLVDNGDGSWRYTPALNDDSAVAFTYTVTDGSASALGIATLDITPVNDAPTTSTVTLAPIAEDSGARLITQAELLANAGDIDGPSLVATNLAINSGLGSLVDNGGGSWSYTPALNDDRSVVFNYLVTDGSLSALGTATLDLTPVNDAPTTNTVSLTPIAEDSGSRRITQADLLANAGDIDGPSLVATNLAITSGLGSLVDNGDGSWSYNPALNDDRSVAFTYTVTDGSASAPGTATLDIAPVNDAPTTSTVTLAPIAEDSGARLITQAELLANAGDIDGPSLVATNLAINSGLGSLVDNGDGSWSYTPALNDDSSVVFTYLVTDGSLSALGTATLNLTPVNDAPTTSTVALAPIAEDSGPRRITQAELLAKAGDIDGPSLVATNLAITSGLGSLVDNGDGSWRYTPALNDDRSVVFTYTVTDGNLSAPGTATLVIAPVNDAPTTSPVTLAPIAEDSGARLITQADLLANAGDIDGPSLVATNLAITSGLGSLVDNGDGSWSYNPALNDDRSVAFTYTVTDGSASAPGTATLDIAPVNDAPTTSTVKLAPIAEDSGARLITQAELLANAGDIDGPSLVATNLAISSGLGSLVDNGGGSWSYTPALNDDRSVVFTYLVTDGSLSALGTATLDLTPVNDAPTTSTVSLTPIAEDSGSRRITQADLLAKAGDIDGPSLVATNLAITSGLGSLVDNGDGSWRYTPALNDDRSVVFTYTVTDGNLSAPGTATLVIAPVNDAPTTSPVTLAPIAEDSGARLITQAELLANAGDIDGPSLVATNLAISSGLGSLVDNGDGSWSYTPALNDDRSVVFTYTVTDGNLSAPGTATLVIAPVNDAPTTSPVTLAPIAEDSGARLITQAELLANAGDIDGPALLATNLAITSGLGSLVDNGDGSWSYSSELNDDRSVVFTYTVTDGNLSAPGTATLDIAPVNDAPTTSTVTLAPIAEDSGARLITQAELLAKAGDIDGPSLVATNLAITSGLGSLVDNGDGSWSYTPALNDDRSVVFTYTVTDGNLSAPGTATLVIAPVNDAPTTSPVTLAPIAEDSGARLITQAELLANAGDIDGPSLVATNLAINSGLGSLVDNGDGSWSYTPALNDDSLAVFTYTVTDGSSSAPGTATLDIAPVNDAPTTAPVTLRSIAEDSGPRLITQAELLANAADTDGPALSATGLAISSGAGSLIANGNGSWTYTPALHDDSSVVFTYSVTDGSLSASGTATLDLMPVNDAPTTSTVTLTPIAEDSGSRRITQAELLARAGDIDGPSLLATNLAITSGLGSLVDNGDGSWSYTPALNDDKSVVFTYTVTDGSLSASGTATLDLMPVNDAPTTAPVTLMSIAEDSGPRLITQTELLANATDVDGNSLSATGLVIRTGAGSLIDNGDRSWTYTPALDDDTSVSFDYAVTDGSRSATGSATLDMTAVDDAPSISLAPLLMRGGASVSIGPALLAASDVDNQSDTLSFVVLEANQGHFESTDMPGSIITAFSQADVAAGRIVFVSRSAVESPGFTLAPFDGNHMGATVTARIDFKRTALAVDQVSAPASAGINEFAPAAQVYVSALTSPQINDGRVRIASAGSERAEWPVDVASPTAGRDLKIMPGPRGIVLVEPAQNGEGRSGATDTLSRKAVDGARSRGNSTEYFDLNARIDVGDYVASLDRFLMVEMLPVSGAGSRGLTGDLGPGPQSESEGSKGGLTLSDAARASVAALTAGTVWWALRAGSLLSGLLVSMPAWRQADLLAVLPDEEEDDTWDQAEDNESARDERAVDLIFEADPGRESQ